MSDAVSGEDVKRVAVIGTGQLGRLIGGGLIANGVEVLPIQRTTRPALRAERLSAAHRVLVAVGEDDLESVLSTLPAHLRERHTWLLQNELLPPAWTAHQITAPTVLVVWAEKKKGKPVAEVQKTLVAGPDRDLVIRALDSVDVRAEPIEDAALPQALVDKNLYILVSNLAGLRVGGTVAALKGDHRVFASQLAEEILGIEAARLHTELAPAPFLERLFAAFAADPSHGCRGRTAEARLARLRAHARRENIATPILDSL